LPSLPAGLHPGNRATKFVTALIFLWLYTNTPRRAFYSASAVPSEEIRFNLVNQLKLRANLSFDELQLKPLK